jgi:hypothetical protein
MKWTKEAEEAVSRVPFFVRKKVKEGRRGSGPLPEFTSDPGTRPGQPETLSEEMDQEVQGQVETCFGPSGCPNRAVDCERLLRN